VAATGANVKLSDDAVMVREPPLAQGSAFAEITGARLLSRIAADNSKRDFIIAASPSILSLCCPTDLLAFIVRLNVLSARIALRLRSGSDGRACVATCFACA